MATAHADAACGEKRLLVKCARTRRDSSTASEICELLSRPLDWDYLLSEAHDNSIVPLLQKQLAALGPGSVPADRLQWLKNAARANTARCLFLTAELAKIAAQFESAGIQAIPYKGPVLAVQAYGDVTQRDFDDLDIILRQRDMRKADEIMVALGYQPRFPWILSSGTSPFLTPGEYNYRDDARRTMVELHTELTLRHFPLRPDVDDFAARLKAVTVGGKELISFSPEDTLILLSIHGAKDFWERISWIADVSELIQAYPRMSWDEIFDRAEAMGAGRMLCVALSLASGLLEAPLSEKVRNRIQADRVAASVAAEVSRQILSRKAAGLGVVGRFRFRWRMVRGGIKGFRYAMRLALVPAEEDWEVFRLPASLSPLYLALRPLRLLRKYGWAGEPSPRVSVK